MPPPVGDALRVLQVHPTRRCNLRCTHCYSVSGPEQRGALPVRMLLAAVADAVAEGYEVLSVSGGEPLLYHDLVPLLDGARAAGLATSLVTNGMLFDARRVAALHGRIDLVGVSIDGVPVWHNRIRNHPRAFEAMVTRLPLLRDAGIPFGFIFTLTRTNAHDLEWVAQLGVAEGARFVHLLPLAEIGRAEHRMPHSVPDDFETAIGWLEAHRVQRLYGDRIRVHTDLVDREHARRQHERLGAGADPAWADRPLSDIVARLVIEADACVVPLEHGFARAHALGSLRDAPLAELARRWRRERAADFAALCRRTLDGLTRSSELPLVSWPRAVARRAAAEAPDAGPLSALPAPAANRRSHALDAR